MELILTGNMINAEEAENWGLVNLVAEDEDLRGKTMDLAGRLLINLHLQLKERKKVLN